MASTIISMFNTVVVMGCFFLALWDLLERPADVSRLRRPAQRPIFFVAAFYLMCVVAALIVYPVRDGFWSLLSERVAPGLVYIAAAGFVLMAGSIWAWRSGIRGKGFGWMRPPRRWGEILPRLPLVASALAVNAVTIGVLYFLPQHVPVEVNPELKEEIDTAVESIGDAFIILLALQVLIAPIFEEILYRHYLQSRLVCLLKNRRGGAWLAIAVASFLWALAHQGMLLPEWVKFAQIFVIGLLFGALQRRWGVAISIAAHLALNVGVLVHAVVSAGN